MRNAENDILEGDLSLGLKFFILSHIPIEKLHGLNVIYCVLFVNVHWELLAFLAKGLGLCSIISRGEDL